MGHWGSVINTEIGWLDTIIEILHALPTKSAQIHHVQHWHVNKIKLGSLVGLSRSIPDQLNLEGQNQKR